MSTTLPESVATQNTATTATTTTTTSTTLPTTASSTTTSSTGLPHHENPAAALDPLTEGTTTSNAAATATELLHQAKDAAMVAGAAISNAAGRAGAAVTSAAHSVDAKYHISDKVNDAASHVSTALKHGNPVHAAKHATTAAAIGEAERNKHAAGPLPDDAHSADSTTASSSSASSSSMSTSSSSSTTSTTSTMSTMGNTASDVASHVQASLGQGNPVHAAKYAGTAAMIGQVEREKHAQGLMEDETAIKEAHAS